MASADDGFSRHDAVPCPHCGHTLDAVGAIDGRDQGAIAPGDFSVCIACATVLEYTVLGGYRLVPEAEWRQESLMQQRELEEIIYRVKAVWLR